MGKRMNTTALLLVGLLGGCSPSKPPETPVSASSQTGPANVLPPTAVSASPSAASSSPEQVAQVSAESWLALMDAGKYGESWNEAAALFKNALDQKTWEKASTGVRAPLGKVESRSFKSRMFTKSLPGAPDGEYVVIKFETAFEHKKSATETVTPMRDPDGTWRVSGYIIR